MSQADNVVAHFPTSWAGDTEYLPGGGLYALAEGVGAGHEQINTEIVYTKAQTRIATATGSSLDQIGADFIGDGGNRTLTITPTALVLESDAAYSARIRSTIVAEQVTVAGMTSLLNQWVQTYYVVDYVLNIQLLGADTAGGLDTWGALDGRSQSVPPIPTITVFDRQSNPRMAAIVGLTSGQFCVLATYGGLLRQGFFLNYTNLGRADHLIDAKLRSISALTPSFDTYVRKIKAVGTVPVYFDNRGQ